MPKSLRFSALIASTLLAAATAVAEPPPDLATRKAGIDWPTFLGPTGDSKSSETGILKKWTADAPKIVWQKKLGTGYDIGSISRGRLFQFDRYGDNARVSCLNAETGVELWKYEYPSSYEDLYGYNNGPRCSPIVDDDLVFTYGVEGVLHCLKAATGEVVWKVDTAAEFGVIQNFFGVGSTPVIVGDLLIVMVGGSPKEDAKLPPGALDKVSGNGSGIVAFDKRTGKVRYQVSDELASYASLKTAKNAGRDWCFAFCRGGLLGFDPRNGKVDFDYPWRAKIMESVNASVPVVVGDEVFISECYGPGSSLLKFAPGKCEVVWKDDARKRAKSMQTHWNTPVYHDGYLYGCSGRHTENAELRCIDWKTGEVKWSVGGISRCSLLYIDGCLIGLAEYGQLFLFKANPEKFELLGERELVEAAAGPKSDAGKIPLLKYPCWSAPIVSHGLLYVRGDDRLICLELISEK